MWEAFHVSRPHILTGRDTVKLLAVFALITKVPYLVFQYRFIFVTVM